MTIRIDRRGFVRATAALAATAPLGGFAQTAGGPIHLLHGYSPGSAPDVFARQLAPGLSENLGVPVVVEARPGAGERLVAGYVARQPADGRTLYVMTGGQTVIAAYDRTLSYDLRRDFTFISTLTEYPFLLLVAPNSPYRTLGDLIEAARKRPGKVVYSSSGVGTTLHLIGELLNATAGTSMTHAPYKGVDAYNDLLGGVLDMSIGTIAGATGLLRDGRLRALAVTSPQRWPGFADVPTIAETVPGVEVLTWMSLVAPAGLNPEQLERLQAATAKALQQPALVSRVEGTGSVARASTPAALKARVEADIDKWQRLIQQARLDLK